MKKNLTVRIGAIVTVLMVAFFSILPDLVSAEGDDSEFQTALDTAEGAPETGVLGSDADTSAEGTVEAGDMGTEGEEPGASEEVPGETPGEGSETVPETPDIPEPGNGEQEPGNSEESTLPTEPTEEELPDGSTSDTEENGEPDGNIPPGEETDEKDPSFEEGTETTPKPEQTEGEQPETPVTDPESGEMDTIEDYLNILSGMEFSNDVVNERMVRLGAEFDLTAYADLFESDEDDFIISADGTTILGYSDTAPGGIVKIPDRIIAIGDGAFMGRSSITGIIFPPNLQSIGTSAFNGCSNLGSISIPDTVTSVGASAFANCTGLAEVYTGAGTGTISPGEFSNCVSLQSIAIPEGVSSIASEAFAGCSNLGSISLPSTLASLDRSAFSGDVNLASISVASGSYSSYDGCVYTADGGQLLICPQGKTGISFSSGMQSVASGAFSGCNYLLSAVIPDATGAIEANAFSGSAIKAVTIPAGVTAIGSQSGWAPNVVYGYRGTTAETWAHESNYVFESLDTVSGGDNNGNEEHIEDPDPTPNGSNSTKPGTSVPRKNLGSSSIGSGTSATISRNAQGRVSSTPKTGVEDYGIYFLFGGIFLIGLAFIAYSRKLHLDRAR